MKEQLKEHKVVFTDPDQWISSSLLFWMKRFLLEKLLWLRSFSWSDQAGWLIMCNQPCGCWRFCCRTRLFWWKTTCQRGRALSQRFPSGASRSGSGAVWTGCEPEKNRILTKRFFFFFVCVLNQHICLCLRCLLYWKRALARLLEATLWSFDALMGRSYSGGLEKDEEEEQVRKTDGVERSLLIKEH